MLIYNKLRKIWKKIGCFSAYFKFEVVYWIYRDKRNNPLARRARAAQEDE